MAKNIEMYRDLQLSGPRARRAELRAALIAAPVAPCRVDLERSNEVRETGMASEDVLLFEREDSDDLPAAGLTLWENEEGYSVPNIVPLEMSELSFTQYNSILDDFISRIAGPAAAGNGYALHTSRGAQTIDDWVSEDVADKLRRFSRLANKSTGASHPMDESRWFDFLIAFHRSGGSLHADQLARWLREVEGWREDMAHRLASDFEKGTGLLAHYDRS